MPTNCKVLLLKSVLSARSLENKKVRDVLDGQMRLDVMCAGPAARVGDSIAPASECATAGRFAQNTLNKHGDGGKFMSRGSWCTLEQLEFSRPQCASSFVWECGAQLLLSGSFHKQAAICSLSSACMAPGSESGCFNNISLQCTRCYAVVVVSFWHSKQAPGQR